MSAPLTSRPPDRLQHVKQLVVWSALTAVMLLQKWVAAGPFGMRLKSTILWIAACIVGSTVLAYLIRHGERSTIAYLALPAFVAASGVVAVGALALQTVLLDVSLPVRFVALFLGNFAVGFILFAVSTVLLLGLNFKAS